MAGKYLKIEDAASRLSMSQDDLNELRKTGKLRAFSDRGTWKFKLEDIEEFARSRTADSDPDFSMMSDDDFADVMMGDETAKNEGSSIVLGDDVVGEMETEISRGAQGRETVNIPDYDELDLSDDDGGTVDAVPSHSLSEDSDVRLVAQPDDDSDVKIADESSGKAVSPARSDTDSDIAIVGADEGTASNSAEDEEDTGTVYLPVDDSGVNEPVDVEDSSATWANVDMDAQRSDVHFVDPEELKRAGSDDLDDSPLQVEDSSAAWARVSDSDVRVLGEDEQLSDKGVEKDSDIMIDDSSPLWKSLGSSGESSPDSVVDATESDVRFSPIDASEKDESDIKLMPEGSSIVHQKPDSDSDVQLVGGEPVGGGSDSDVESLSTVDPDSGLSLAPLDDSSLTLEPADDSDDESVLDLDSGLSLASDSGIALDLAADSGISLVGEDDDSITLAADSGISLEDAGESGFALMPEDDDEDDGEATMPMLELSSQEMDLVDEETSFDLSGADDSSYELSADSDEGAGVVMFDDDDFDEASETMVRKSGEEDSGDSVFDLSSVDDLDEDLDIDDDVIGEDDSLDELDVFDADDEDFEDGFESGESQPEFVSPLGGRGQAVAVESKWGAVEFTGVLLSTLLMFTCMLITIDLVRSMWALEEPLQVNSILLDNIAGLF